MAKLYDPTPPKMPTWDEVIADLRTLEYPFAEPLATLLEASKGRWEGRVSAKRIFLVHHPGLPRRPGIGVGFQTVETTRRRSAPEVTLSWEDGVYEMRLTSEWSLVTADRCRAATAEAVLDAFLVQLEGDPQWPSPFGRRGRAPTADEA